MCCDNSAITADSSFTYLQVNVSFNMSLMCYCSSSCRPRVKSNAASTDHPQTGAARPKVTFEPTSPSLPTPPHPLGNGQPLATSNDGEQRKASPPIDAKTQSRRKP